MSDGVVHGFRDARRSIGASVAGAIAAASWFLIGLAGALERPVSRAVSADRSEPSLIEAAAFGVILPLASYAFCARLGSTRESLMSAYWARHGVSRRGYALGRIGFCAALGAALMLTSAVLAFGVSRAVFGAPEAGSAALSLAVLILISALGALSYAACFSLAQLVAGGFGRAAFLALDWLLGSGAGLAALPWPRAHLRSLLGGPAVAGMGAYQTTLFLLCIALACVLLCARRVPP